jgi:hypothetical protein
VFGAVQRVVHVCVPQEKRLARLSSASRGRSQRARGADRVTNARDSDCTKRVHDRVHDVVQIAWTEGGTRVANHTCTDAVTEHVVSQRKSCAPRLASRRWRRRSGVQFSATARARQGSASTLRISIRRALDPPSALAARLALTGATAASVATSRPERRVRPQRPRCSRKKAVARTALRAMSTNSFSRQSAIPCRRVAKIVLHEELGDIRIVNLETVLARCSSRSMFQQPGYEDGRADFRTMTDTDASADKSQR